MYARIFFPHNNSPPQKLFLYFLQKYWVLAVLNVSGTRLFMLDPVNPCEITPKKAELAKKIVHFVAQLYTLRGVPFNRNQCQLEMGNAPELNPSFVNSVNSGLFVLIAAMKIANQGAKIDISALKFDPQKIAAYRKTINDHLIRKGRWVWSVDIVKIV